MMLYIRAEWCGARQGVRLQRDVQEVFGGLGGFQEREDDALVVPEVVAGEGSSTAVLEPFLRRSVAANRH